METNPAVLMSKAEREKIITLFATKRDIPFTVIEEAVGLRSNHLVYFIKQLQDEGIVVKDGAVYNLTPHGQSLVPRMVHLTGKENPPLAVVAAAVIKDNRICFIKRAKMPFQGYWGMVGGKLRQNETIIDAAVREVEEETGLHVAFEHYCGLCHEHVKEAGAIKHSFLLFLCKMKVLGGELRPSVEGDVAWFDLNALPRDTIIPSDLWMLDNMLHTRTRLNYSTMEDTKGTYVLEGKFY